MNSATWASTAQLGLTAITALIAFAVYRVQADKLFIELREKRWEALERYRRVVAQRLGEISELNRTDLAGALTPDKIQGSVSEMWEAEHTMSVWFGPEVRAAVTATGAAVNAFLRVKVDRSIKDDLAGFEHETATHLAAHSAYKRVFDATAPYLNADRRGLPLIAWLKAMWLSK